MEFPCPICKKDFQDGPLLATHCTQAPHHNKAYKCTCKICGKSFDHAASWGKHFLERHNTKTTCPLCGKSFLDFLHLAKHCYAEHDGIAYDCSCKVCEKRFKTTATWGRHFEKNHDTNCPICGTEFVNFFQLARHCESSHKAEKFQCMCQVCGKMFSIAGDWGRHCLRRHGHCQVCYRVLRNSVHLAEHCQKKHVGVPSLCACKICAKQYNTTADWGKHFVKHFELQQAGSAKIENKLIEQTKTQMIELKRAKSQLQDFPKLKEPDIQNLKIQFEKLEQIIHEKDTILLEFEEKWNREKRADKEMWGEKIKEEIQKAEERKIRQLSELEKRKNEEIVEIEKLKKAELRFLEEVKNREIEKLKIEGTEKIKKEVEKLRLLLQQSSLFELHTHQQQILITNDEDLKKQSKEIKRLDQAWNNILHLPLPKIHELVQEQKKFLHFVRDTIETKKQEHTLCLVCWEKERNVACVPCGHKIYCLGCSDAMLGVPCAVCREKVQQLVRIFDT